MVSSSRRKREESALPLPLAPRLIFPDAIYEKNEFLARTGMSEEKLNELRSEYGLKVVRLGQATAVHGSEYDRVIRKMMGSA